MEFPNLGKHCSYPVCNKLDFLPVKCDACQKIFCHEHMRYEEHGCVEGSMRDFQVPVCPLCNKPVVSPRGERPDVAVGAHIDNDCQSDPAVGRRKVFTNKCSIKGCKRKEMVPLLCNECHYNYCIVHRHSSDHQCAEKKLSNRNNGPSRNEPVTTVSSLRPCLVNDIQGNLDEDEALAHAIALSLADTEEDSSVTNRQTSSRPDPSTTHSSSPQGNNASCNIS